jgi:hypothetical protein
MFFPSTVPAGKGLNHMKRTELENAAAWHAAAVRGYEEGADLRHTQGVGTEG